MASTSMRAFSGVQATSANCVEMRSTTTGPAESICCALVLACVDEDDGDMDEEELPDDGVLLLPGDVAVDEPLVLDPVCGRVEVWAWRHKAAANRAGVPARMNFNGRFMVMFSRLVPTSRAS